MELKKGRTVFEVDWPWVLAIKDDSLSWNSCLSSWLVHERYLHAFNSLAESC